MNGSELRAAQAPWKARYRDDPTAALVTLSAQGGLEGAGLACRVGTARGVVEAGLHPAAGGDGLAVCSGNMLLEALVACAGVTLRAVAAALELNVRGGTVTARGELDFRGTLAVDKQAPVGFKTIQLDFELQTDAEPEQVATLLKLTERYCVLYQTLKNSPETTLTHRIVAE